MKSRFYIAPQIWRQETLPDSHVIEYWSSLLNDFINVHAGEWFDEVDHPGRHISICCVDALDASHSNMLADSRVCPVSGLFDSREDIPSGVNSTLDSVPNISVMKTKLENLGIDTTWITGATSVKQALRFILKLFSISQHLTGKKLLLVRHVLEVSPDLTVTNIPTEKRNAVRNWMENKGLAVDWITGTTTLRQVVNYIMLHLPFGKIRMGGVDF